MQSNPPTYLMDEALLADYVDSPTRDFAVSVLEKLLHPLTPPERFEFTVRCGSRSGATVFTAAVVRNHQPKVQCLLRSLSQEQRFTLLKSRDSFEVTTVHRAVYAGYTELLTGMLNILNPELSFEHFKMRT